MTSLPGDQTNGERLISARVDLGSPGQNSPEFLADLLDQIYEPVSGELEHVRQKLNGLAMVDSPFVSDILGYVLENSGKRMRPALSLLASKFNPNDGRMAETLACVVELLHIAALIHDDTVDNSDFRRGKATVSSLWGRKAAVILGDYLVAASATFVCETENFRVIRRFSETAMELSRGELFEMAGAYDSRQTREQYLQHIHNKTASLFTVAGETSAVLSGAPEHLVQALKEYSYNLGMAFQVVDDILDFDGTREERGKPVGNDLAQGTMTLPVILAVERDPEDSPILALFRRPGDEESLRRAVELIQDSSIIEESYAVADEYCRKALDCLTRLEPNPSLDSLEKLVHYVMRRRN